MPRDVAHEIFDAYIRTDDVPLAPAGPWPEELALIGSYGDDAEEWIMTAVGQDWDPMPSDVQARLDGVVTYSEGSSVLRWRWAGFDSPERHRGGG
jgi:hypothetical protein